MEPKIVIIDCLPGFHRPPTGELICVPDEPVPVTPVPTLDDGSLVLLIALVVAVGAMVLR